MIILAIETSCDETAVAVIKTSGKLNAPNFKILSSVVSSQTKIHAHWGGVVPSLARREHEKNLIPILAKVLKKAFPKIFNFKFLILNQFLNSNDKIFKQIQKILERETELSKQFFEAIPNLGIPPIDAIAITVGPGLEPALWVGLNFAKALAVAWNKPLIPVNHLEGHIFSVLLNNNSALVFPAIALLVSGGHTELVLMRGWLKYETIGQTRDDAAGECFDKSARVLGLPYPGGPQVAKLASQWKSQNTKYQIQNTISLPRPMLNSGDFDFSFSGLKTSVLYKARDLNLGCVIPGEKKDRLVQEFCHEIQQSIIDVLISKTIAAAKKHNVKTIILGGGVAANKELRRQLRLAVKNSLPRYTLHIPPSKFSGDNAAMIAAAASFRAQKQKKSPISEIKKKSRLKADGNLGLK